jgi:crotonobetainyl-CoA:carnitine CoA-transferase CaiB-like acyl-CoA transferase
MIAGFAILGALLARQRTGRGQYVDVSMFDVMLSMLPIPAAHHFAGATIPVGGKYVLSGAYPFYNVYETGDEKFMTLGALEPKFWANFCLKVDREDLIARQFDAGERRANLLDEVRGIFRSRTQTEWIDLMRDADCCCEPVLSISEAFNHVQTRAREMVREVEGSNQQLGFAYKMSGTPPREASRAPELGEHTAELLAAVGIDNEDRDRLSEAGVIVTYD